MSQQNPNPRSAHPTPTPAPRPLGLWLSSRGAVCLEDAAGKLRDRRGQVVVGAVTVASVAGAMHWFRPVH